ncbi:hypothetical protein OG229_01435 [Streptomyces platensis]|uniref:hypothetical protein n=1 Tax=Streptomyces platensis TaxID=58346 RepID=UPI002E1171D7|nr:hypothetical protein OG229_01435 [Streptomyces platensis]
MLDPGEERRSAAHRCPRRRVRRGRRGVASLTGIQWITDGYTLVFAGLLLTGMLLGAAGLAGWAAAGPDPDYLLLVGPMMAAGFGTSFALTGATATVMSAAPDAYSGTASALFNTTRQIGSAAGVALGGSLLAAAAGFPAGLRTGMAIGAAAYLMAAALAFFCVPPKGHRRAAG